MKKDSTFWVIIGLIVLFGISSIYLVTKSIMDSKEIKFNAKNIIEPSNQVGGLLCSDIYSWKGLFEIKKTLSEEIGKLNGKPEAEKKEDVRVPAINLLCTTFENQILIEEIKLQLLELKKRNRSLTIS